MSVGDMKRFTNTHRTSLYLSTSATSRDVQQHRPCKPVIHIASHVSQVWRRLTVFRQTYVKRDQACYPHTPLCIAPIGCHGWLTTPLTTCIYGYTLASRGVLLVLLTCIYNRTNIRMRYIYIYRGQFSGGSYNSLLHGHYLRFVPYNVMFV